jgi:hypothetical protein
LQRNNFATNPEIKSHHLTMPFPSQAPIATPKKQQNNKNQNCSSATKGWWQAKLSKHLALNLGCEASTHMEASK